MGAIQDLLNKYGNETVQIIRGNLSSTGTNASGKTSASVQSVSTPNSVTVSGKAFIYVVETGRKPGKQPPLSNILEWLQTGKASFTGTIENAARGISFTIGKFGSLLFRSGGREDIITPALDDKRIDQLTSDIADVSFDKVVDVIEKGIN